MYRKNVAGQFCCFQMLLTATGAIATGLSPATRRCIDGTFAGGGGTVTEDGSTGAYKYAMAQADTNGNDISLIFTASGAMPVCVNFVTTAADPTNAASFGLTNLDAAITSRMATYTQPTGFLAATFPTGTIANTTNITSITGNITGNLSGSVGSVTGLTASNLDATVSSRMATYTQPSGFLAATFPASVASPTNITAGTITTVTNLTNAPTAGDLTATMKASVTTAATAATPVAASVTGAVGSVTGAVGSVTGNVGGNVVGSVGSVTARVTANVDQFNGDSTAAANIAKTTAAIGRGTVTSGGSTTSIPTSACAPTGVVTDQFKGRIITFDATTTTTALRGQSTDITASSGVAAPTFTVTALTTAPVSGDTFSMT